MSPIPNAGRVATLAGGLGLLGFGIAAVARSADSRMTGAIVLGGVLLGCAIRWDLANRLLARPGRWPRLVVAIACAVIIGMFCTNVDMGGDPRSPRGDGEYRPVLARGDGHMLYLMARSTALDTDWIFDNDLAGFGDPWRQPATATGRKSIAHPIGPALVWTPLIWVAQAGALVANGLGAEIEPHGYTLWHQRIVFLSSAVFACAAVLLGRRLARQVIGGMWAPSYAAIAVLLGTSLTYYATFMPSYAHAMDAFACAAFLGYWAFTLGRRDARRWLVLGLLLGIATLIRVQELAMGIVVAIEIGVRLVEHRREPRLLGRWLLGGVLALGVALVVFIPQLLEWQLVFGTITELPQGAKYTRLEAPMVMELLYAPRNGWFSTTPIAYAGVIGLLCVPRKARLVAAGLLAAVAIQVYLNSTILDWWAGSSFGQRRMCNVTLPLVVGVAALIWRLGRLAARWRPWVSHGVLVSVAGLLIGWNLDTVGRLSGGRPATAEFSPGCCSRFPAPLRGLTRWFHARFGDPFQFPATAIFALRHDVSMSRWGDTVGNYPLIPALDTLATEAFWSERGRWNLADPDLEPYLVSGFSWPIAGERAFRWTIAPSATILVPNLMPDGQRLTLSLLAGGASHAVVRWNGQVVAEVDVVGWQRVRFELPDIALHTNELTIEAIPGPTSADGVVGVGVESLELELIHPRAGLAP